MYYVLKLALGAFALCLCVAIYCFALSWLCLFWFQARLFLATSYVLRSFMREPIDTCKNKTSDAPRKDDTTPRPPHAPVQKDKREADDISDPEITNGESSVDLQHSKQPAIHQAQTLDAAAAAGTTRATGWAYQQNEHPQTPEEKTFSERENVGANAEEADAEKPNEEGAVSYGQAKRVRFSSYEFPSIVNLSGTRQPELKQPNIASPEPQQQLRQPETAQKPLKKTKQEKMEEDQTAWLSRMRSDSSDDEAPRKAFSELTVGQQHTGKNASHAFAPRAATAPQYSADQLEAAKNFMRGASRTPQQARMSRQANMGGSKTKSKGPLTSASPSRKDSGFAIPSSSAFASAVPPHLAKLQSIQNEKDQTDKSKDGTITTKTPLSSDVPGAAMENIVVFEAPEFIAPTPRAKETRTSEATQSTPPVTPDDFAENDSPEVNPSTIDDTPLAAGSPTLPNSASTRIFTADALKSMNTSQTHETLDPDAEAYQCWQCQRWTPCQDTKVELGLCAPCKSVHTRIGDARNILAGGPSADDATGPSPVPVYKEADFDQFTPLRMARPFQSQGFPGFKSRAEALRFFGGHPTKKHKPKHTDFEVASSNSEDTSDALSAIEDEQAPQAEAHAAANVLNGKLSGEKDVEGTASNSTITPATDKDKQPLSTKKLQREAKHAAREALKEAWRDREYARTQVNGGHTQERVQGLREATARYTEKRGELMALMGNGILNDEDASMYPLFGAIELTAPKNRPFTITEVKAKKKAQKEVDDAGELDGSDEAASTGEGVDRDLLNAMAKAKELRAQALDYFNQGRPQSNIRYTEWKARGDGGLERANKYYNKKRVALLEALGGQLTPDLQARYPPL